MYQFEINLIVWFACGVISATVGHRPDIEHLQKWSTTNGTETGIQSISRIRDRQHQQQHQQQYQQQHQSQYQYGLTKPANKQQVHRGRSNGLNELRKNLTAQKLWERQGDDPDQNTVNLSPIHQIHQKIQQSDVSTRFSIRRVKFFFVQPLIPLFHVVCILHAFKHTPFLT